MSTTSAVNSLSFEAQLNEDLKYIVENMKVEQATKTVDAVIKDAAGNIIFEKKNVEAPINWSQLSINIAAEKYFIKTGPKAEDGIREMCHRVACEIADAGCRHNYFDDTTHAAFLPVLQWLLENQYFCFNSPVWFNVGVQEKPQISACFIVGIEDTMESILETAKVEGMIYKGGSGSGINYSALRGKGEALSKGGHSSGPMSFIKLGDSVAGSIKSGGTTRRAAKMVILNADHPDIEEFIDSKTKEEEKARVLIEAGYESDFRSESGAYATVAYQNANHSVRVPDVFMAKVENDGEWPLVARKDGHVMKTIKAKELFRKIAEAAWRSGDPGLQFNGAINRWNSLAADGNINGSNPCSEYMSLDNTSCNLASINLMKFHRDTDKFNYELFEKVSKFVTLCLDILISEASYPTEIIAKNVEQYRQIGLGYANLGALLMINGYAYDSLEARDLAASITALMTASAYAMSADMAKQVGPFSAYERNEESMISVLEDHQDALWISNDQEGFSRANDLFQHAIDNCLNGKGLRNSYVTNIAPTGTIGLVMGCDTTGIEPELALVKYKKLVGGGVIKIVNDSVRQALENLGILNPPAVIEYIEEHGSAAGSPELDDDEEKIFATSFDPKGNTIHWRGHIDMMAAVQPFLSGSISKTVNMPKDATVEDVEEAYKYAWEKHLKCIAIYRDGCKDSQPMNTSKEQAKVSKTGPMERKKLPDSRPSITHKFNIAGHEGYFTVGLYENGQPGEIFVVISKEGTFVSGLFDTWATMISIALQYGAPLELIIDKLKGHNYDPQGITSNPDIRMAKSITDYIGRWMELKFCSKTATISTNGNGHKTMTVKEINNIGSWGNICSECGGTTYQAGTCSVCNSCGTTTGCS